MKLRERLEHSHLEYTQAQEAWQQEMHAMHHEVATCVQAQQQLEQLTTELERKQEMATAALAEQSVLFAREREQLTTEVATLMESKVTMAEALDQATRSAAAAQLTADQYNEELVQLMQKEEQHKSCEALARKALLRRVLLQMVHNTVTVREERLSTELAGK